MMSFFEKIRNHFSAKPSIMLAPELVAKLINHSAYTVENHRDGPSYIIRRRVDDCLHHIKSTARWRRADWYKGQGHQYLDTAELVFSLKMWKSNDFIAWDDPHPMIHDTMFTADIHFYEAMVDPTLIDEMCGYNDADGKTFFMIPNTGHDCVDLLHILGFKSAEIKNVKVFKNHSVDEIEHVFMMFNLLVES